MEKVVISVATGQAETVALTEAEISEKDAQDAAWTAAAPVRLQAAITAALEAHLDAVAREKQYSGALSIATYVGSGNTAWDAEATTFVAWRDSVWEYALAELAKVQGGQRSAPTVAEFIGELPGISWPE